MKRACQASPMSQLLRLQITKMKAFLLLHLINQLLIMMNYVLLE